LKDENKQVEQAWDLKLQKLRSQADITIQQLQQQLATQEEEVPCSNTLNKHYNFSHPVSTPFPGSY